MIELTDPQSPDGVSDWIELQASVTQENIQRGRVSAAIRGALGTEPSDDFIAEVWLEIAARDANYNPSLFTFDEFGVAPLASSEFKKDVYQLCLILSLYGAFDQTGTVQDLFERVTNEALRVSLRADSMVFGYRGRGIGEGVRGLATVVNEKFVEEPARRFKDRGLDVVSWIPFSDTRTGKIVVLTQCAAGHNWKGKVAVPIRAWEQYIHWAVRPTMAFSVPCIISDREWHDQSSDKGMLIDRVRLMNSMPERPHDGVLEDEVNTWVGNWLGENNTDE